MPALAVELLAESRLDQAGEGDVDVVAAEQDVIADREPLERQPLAVGTDPHQAEVRCAAADVDDQDELVRAQALLPVGGVRADPGVERGLRFLEERDAGQAGLPRGGDRELARDLVERCRHGQHDILRGERMVGESLVPGLAQVREVARRGRDR